jgi:hypothetical protein
VHSRNRTERRWPVAVALVVAIAVELLLPPRLSPGPSWAVPTVELLLLAGVVIADRGFIEGRSPVVRALCLALVAVLVAEAALLTARLVADLIHRAAPRQIRRLSSSASGSESGSARTATVKTPIQSAGSFA